MRAADLVEEDIKLLEQKHQQLEKKIISLKINPGVITYGLVDLLRRLKLLKSENLMRGFIEMESNDITFERVKSSGSKINGKKIAIIVKFLNYKDKDAALNQHGQKGQ